MDLYSKLGLLASELLEINNGHNHLEDKGKIAMVFSNRTGSYYTDKIHADALTGSDGVLVSPSVFVYTLPNIVQGEISIRNGITGEAVFLASNEFDADMLLQETEVILQLGGMERVLLGWIDFDAGSPDVFMAIIEKSDPGKQEKNPNFITINPELLKNLYRVQHG